MAVASLTNMVTPAALVNTVVCSAPATSAMRRLLDFRSHRDPRLAVLTYHRVAPAGPTNTPGIVSATPENFAAQMDFVASELHPIGPDDLTAARAGAPLPANATLVTFDDAYVDFAEYAWPVLQARDIPVVLFVPTAFPDSGQGFWWDRLYLALTQTDLGSIEHHGQGIDLHDHAARSEAYRSLRGEIKALPHAEAMAMIDDLIARLGPPPEPPPVLGWESLLALHHQGVHLAAHSHRHPLFDRVAPAELDDELTTSRAELGARLGTAPTVMAYPGGHLNRDVVTATERAGFEIAFSTERGINHLDDIGRADWLQLRRINVGQRTTPGLLLAQLVLYRFRCGGPLRRRRDFPGTPHRSQGSDRS